MTTAKKRSCWQEPWGFNNIHNKNMIGCVSSFLESVIVMSGLFCRCLAASWDVVVMRPLFRPLMCCWFTNSIHIFYPGQYPVIRKGISRMLFHPEYGFPRAWRVGLCLTDDVIPAIQLSWMPLGTSHVLRISLFGRKDIQGCCDSYASSVQQQTLISTGRGGTRKKARNGSS